MTDDRTVFEIPECNIQSFEAAIAKISRKSLRLTGYGIKPVLIGYKYKQIGKDSIKVLEVLLTGEEPRIEGWRFIATIEHTESGNILRSVPNSGVSIPEHYRTAKASCDHCQRIRSRKDTYLLVCEADSKIMQIGKSCLKDFLGGHDPKRVAAYAESLGFCESIAREANDGSSSERYFPIEPFLRHVSTMVRLFGWVSRSAAKNSETMVATSERAYGNMFPAKGDTPEPITDEDRETAQAALAWARGLEGASDFEHNLKTIASEEMITYRGFGMAAAIVSGYLNVKTKRIEKIEIARSAHIGAIKDKVSFASCTVLSHSSFEHAYGLTHIYRFEVEGNVLVWFASSDQEINRGDIVSIKGTIKDHDTYKDVAQTVLTRCKIEVQEAEAVAA